MQSLMPPVDAPNNEFSDGNPRWGRWEQLSEHCS